MAPYAWASDDDSVVTVSAAGVATAHAAGLARITVTDANGLTASTWVRVTYRFALLPGAPVLLAGEEGSFAAQAPAAAPLTWRSLDESVATVDGFGTVTAVAFGETVIVAADANGVSATGSVQVTCELAIAPEAPHVQVGESLGLAVVGEAALPLTWATLDEAVATVDGTAS